MRYNLRSPSTAYFFLQNIWFCRIRTMFQVPRNTVYPNKFQPSFKKTKNIFATYATLKYYLRHSFRKTSSE